MYLNIASYLYGKQIRSKLRHRLYLWMIFVFVPSNLRYLPEYSNLTFNFSKSKSFKFNFLDLFLIHNLYCISNWRVANGHVEVDDVIIGNSQLENTQKIRTSWKLASYEYNIAMCTCCIFMVETICKNIKVRIVHTWRRHKPWFWSNSLLSIWDLIHHIIKWISTFTLYRKWRSPKHDWFISRQGFFSWHQNRSPMFWDVEFDDLNTLSTPDISPFSMTMRLSENFPVSMRTLS